MATVRISQRLYEDIVNNTRKLFRNRIKQAKENYNKAWGSMIASNLYPATVIENLNKLDTGWIKQSRNIEFEGFYNTPNELTIKNYHLKYSDIPSFPVPNKGEVVTQYGWKLNSTYGGECDIELDATNPKWDTLHKEYEEYASKIQEIEQEEKSTVDTVTKVLDNYSTLAPCIKVLPKIYDLLPEETKDRHNEVLNKSNRATPEQLDIDTSKLDVAMVKDKITKGGNE